VRETASAGKADCHRCQVAKPASQLWLDVGRKSSGRRARAGTAQRGARGRARVVTMTAARVGWCAGDGPLDGDAKETNCGMVVARSSQASRTKPASWLWLDIGRKSSRRRARAATAQRGAGGRTRVATMTAAQVGRCAGDGCTHDDCLPFRFDLSFPSFLILSLKMHGRGAERCTACDMHAARLSVSSFLF
jgi:hypothetical protein